MCDQVGCSRFRATDGMGNDQCGNSLHARWNGTPQGMLYAGQYPMPAPDGSTWQNGVLYNSNGQIEQFGSNTWPQQEWVSAQAMGSPIADLPQVVVSGPTPIMASGFGINGGVTFGSVVTASVMPMAGWGTSGVNRNGIAFNEATDAIPKARGSVVIGRYRTAELPRTPTLPRLCCIDHQCDVTVHWWSYTENELVRDKPTGRPFNAHFWRAWIQCGPEHMWISFFLPEEISGIEFTHDEAEAVDDVYEETAVLERLIDDYAERIKAQRKFLKKRDSE